MASSRRIRARGFSLCVFVCHFLAGNGVAAERMGAPAAASCAPNLIEGGTSAVALDGRTLELADGRRIRLAGIEPPIGADAARRTLATLEELTAGRAIHLRTEADAPDRYGRLIAFAFVDGTDASVQEELVRRGRAWVWSQSTEEPCLTKLRAAERSASEQKLGLWADPSYGIRAASDPGALIAGRGRFAVVAGKVLSVRESGGMIYLNFGRRWTSDFTVGIRKRNEQAFAAALQSLKRLEGRLVRVRGWIEVRGGPWIEADHPRQIEVDGPR